MLLRTRITALVAVGFVLLASALLGSAVLRERLLQEQLAETAIQAQSALWREIVEVETRQLDATLARLSAWPLFEQALQKGNLGAAADALQGSIHVLGDVEWLALVGHSPPSRPICRAARRAGSAPRRVLASRRPVRSWPGMRGRNSPAPLPKTSPWRRCRKPLRSRPARCFRRRRARFSPLAKCSVMRWATRRRLVSLPAMWRPMLRPVLAPKRPWMRPPIR